MKHKDKKNINITCNLYKKYFINYYECIIIYQLIVSSTFFERTTQLLLNLQKNLKYQLNN